MQQRNLRKAPPRAFYLRKKEKPATKILKSRGLQLVYSDKYGIFRVNIPSCVNKEQTTQFGRAYKELGYG